MNSRNKRSLRLGLEDKYLTVDRPVTQALWVVLPYLSFISRLFISFFAGDEISGSTEGWKGNELSEF
jgi:hypothetical protein|uniref:Uncharacterized protein n=1 Tax=Picea glauca TaxID=3330 RepID=A0A101M453_PICGL|nr:hypothetical protein ABT39_MTgene494 [Picea glauca]QHR91376.1 hypothetical protein Q903MT_gene5410 [Picea sitchensis]